MLGKYCMGYRPVEVAILYSVRDIAVGWVIFATYFFISAPRAFFGVMALSDHKYSF